MNHRRILVLTTIDDDPRPTFDTIRHLFPAPDQIIVTAERSRSLIPWLAPTSPSEADEASSQAIESLQAAARGAAATVDVAASEEITAAAVADAVTASSIDLLVVGSPRRRLLALAGALQKRQPLPVLCVGSTSPGVRGQGNRLGCLEVTTGDNAALLAFLRDHAGPADRATLLSSRPLSPEELEQMREVAGVAPQLEPIPGPEGRWRRLLGARTSGEFDVLVVARFPPLILLEVKERPPVLVVPRSSATVAEWERALDVSDAVDDGRSIRLRVDYATGVGRRTPIEDQELAFVHGGAVVARAPSIRGEVELPSGTGKALGVVRTRRRPTSVPGPSIEAQVAVLRAEQRPVVLYDAELDEDALSRLRKVPAALPVAVRVLATRSCAALRKRVHQAGLEPHVIDAGAVLGEGDAPDVPEQVDAVRLARAAMRLRASGLAIAAIVYRGPHRPSTPGVAAVLPGELPQLVPEARPPAAPASLDERLDTTTGSELTGGNRIEVELDNPRARGWLLSAIESSRERVHFQVYMGLDDDVGGPVEAAMAAAGARGVKVRALIDSLHGQHGSFGQHNPLFERMSSRPGIELRVGSPITGAPTVEQLKQRNHRKLVVVDGKVALLGGRNLSHEYYTGFAEVPLRPDMTWRMVPWLDAGARVEGPAVAVLERAFLEAWSDAGGAPFDIPVPAAAGSTRARVVAHRGLRDAFTLEAQLGLIDSARSHVYVVNGFPLVLELQNALLRALRRKVRVRTMIGNLTPRHGSEPFRGPMATARIAATEFVQSRMDPLVAAGAECFELVIPRQSSWDPAIPEIRPHVHAKTMSVDGRVCAVGSANCDVTAAYWEDELLLVVEDESIARGVEARFDELMAGSERFDRDDPRWRRRSELRRWMRYWPGMLG